VTESEVYAFGAVSKIPYIVYWILLAVLVVGFALILFSQQTQKTQKIARLMLMEWVVLIFCSAVIFREARAERAINLVPLSSYFCIAENSYLKEVAVINLLNICMFLPVGFFLKCGYRSVTYKKVFLVGFIVSFFVELLQFTFSKGLCEVDDVIHNSLGCMVGYWIANLMLYLNLNERQQ
jgi:glycopeptide antibiotics resistance protein